MTSATTLGGDSLAGLDVALVHDYLNQRGGAERVVLELSDIWPHAPIYTSLYRPDSTLTGFRDRTVITSPLDRLGVDRGFRNLFPLYPAAFASFGEIDADIVIASSSGWAHMARTSPRALHVVYCHNPARWLYQPELRIDTDRQRLQRWFTDRSRRPLLRLDRRAALRADLYIANSQNVQRRIKAVYGIDAELIHPPVDIERFTPTPRGERLLVVSRLIPYKNVELAIRAANHLGIGLDIVGDGPLMPDLRRIAGPHVELHGAVDDATTTALMQSCRAVLVMAEEDFGMVAVEAQAAGKPVVAYGKGGSLETVQDGVTGARFDQPTEDAVVTAIHAADALGSSPEQIAHNAQQFSRNTFRARLVQVCSQR